MAYVHTLTRRWTSIDMLASAVYEYWKTIVRVKNPSPAACAHTATHTEKSPKSIVTCGKSA